MYTRLSKIMTKSYFRKILDDALSQAKKEYENSPNIPINQSIYNQLMDIKKTVVEENHVYSEDEANGKYFIGIQAIRNFDGYDNFPYKDMLIDIDYGIPLYPTMPEE